MKLNIINFDDLFDPEMVVTSSTPVSRQKFHEDGIYSPRIFGDIKTDKELKRGWVTFGDNYVINPVMYTFLKKAVPKLDRILETSRQSDLDGNITVTNEIDDIGLVKFRKDFDHYMKEYGKPDSVEYKFIMKNKERLFINKFPIFAAQLRPVMLYGNNVTHDYINDVYNVIVEYSNLIRDLDVELEGGSQLDMLLYGLQTEVNKIVTEVIDGYLKTKKGLIRNNMLGIRVNYSARNIISPLVGHSMDEVKIGYLPYLYLYKKLLINIVVKAKGYSFTKAEEYWRQCTTHFDEEMYGYMTKLNEETVGGQWILLNRNPSISIGSIIELRITGIKREYDDLTLELSNLLLESLSGDYDGDVLNIIPLFTTELTEAFSCFKPSSLIVNNNDGNFNDKLFLSKEENLAL